MIQQRSAKQRKHKRFRRRRLDLTLAFCLAWYHDPLGVIFCSFHFYSFPYGWSTPSPKGLVFTNNTYYLLQPLWFTLVLSYQNKPWNTQNEIRYFVFSGTPPAIEIWLVETFDFIVPKRKITRASLELCLARHVCFEIYCELIYNQNTTNLKKSFHSAGWVFRSCAIITMRQ